jgi:hypothetical protein
LLPLPEARRTLHKWRLVQEPRSPLQPIAALPAALEELFESRVRTRFSTLDSIEKEIGHADAVSGAVLLRRARSNASIA